MCIQFLSKPNQTQKFNIATTLIRINIRSGNALAFPTLDPVARSVIYLIVGVVLVYSFSRALKLRPKPITIAKPRKETAAALIVSVALFILVFAWRTLTKTFQLQPPENTVSITFGLWDAFLYGMGFVVIIVAMKITRQNIGSIGINRKDTGKMLFLGFAISAILLAIYGLLTISLGGGFVGFSYFLAYDLILSIIVGFSEEIFWRGYIQTRLIAYSGTIKGLVVTSLLFAVLWHFPIAYYVETSGVVLEALAWALLRFPIGLLLGYIMVKSQNIIPSSIIHLFIDWNLVLWLIP